MNWLTTIPHWLKEIPHVAWAFSTFALLCALWLITRDHDVLGYVGTALGLICGLLTGRALSSPSPPPTDESVKTLTTIERHTDPPQIKANEPGSDSDHSAD